MQYVEQYHRERERGKVVKNLAGETTAINYGDEGVVGGRQVAEEVQ